jgi:hypothetical protein
MAPADFVIKGPTLRAEGKGQLDLARQQIDQQFTVTVPMSSAVPVAAAVMGGPLVGGAVAVAQLALEHQIGKVTQFHYHINGTWSNPQVDKFSSVDTLDSSSEGGSATPAAAHTAPVNDTSSPPASNNAIGTDTGTDTGNGNSNSNGNNNYSGNNRGDNNSSGNRSNDDNPVNDDDANSSDNNNLEGREP